LQKSYQRCIEQWDRIFAAESTDRAPQTPDSGNASFDAGVRWLVQGSSTVLDFGCGNGSVLFFCALLGTKKHIGVDLSKSAVCAAINRSKHMKTGVFDFRRGGVERLSEIASGSIDAIILSNILDNLYPEDAETLLTESTRLLKPGGKVLIKLNAFITDQQISDWNIQVMEGNLLDDGLLLWNNTTEQWKIMLERFFAVERYEELWYPEHEQINRMFLVSKR